MKKILTLLTCVFLLGNGVTTVMAESVDSSEEPTTSVSEVTDKSLEDVSSQEDETGLVQEGEQIGVVNKTDDADVVVDSSQEQSVSKDEVNEDTNSVSGVVDDQEISDLDSIEKKDNSAETTVVSEESNNVNVLMEQTNTPKALSMPVERVATLEGVEGSGTQDDPYLVDSQDDFAVIDSVDGSQYIYVKLVKDITLTAKKEVGDYTTDVQPLKDFYGEFDGDNHVITVDGNSLIFITEFNGGVLKNFTWNLNGDAIELVSSQLGSAVYENITVSGMLTYPASYSNVSPLVVYSYSDSTFDGITLDLQFSGAGYHSLLCGYEPSSNSDYIFRNITIKGNYIGQHLGILFCNGANNGDFGLQHVVGNDPTSTVAVANITIEQGTSIKGTVSEPHLLCGVSWDNRDWNERYVQKETELLKAGVTGFDEAVSKAPSVSADVRLSSANNVVVKFANSEALKNIGRVEVVSLVYANNYDVSTGEYNGTQGLRVTQSVPVQSGMTEIDFSIGKIVYYDGTGDSVSTTGLNGEYGIVKVGDQTYYQIPFNTSGYVMTFGSSATPSNTTREGTVYVNFYDNEDHFIGTVNNIGTTQDTVTIPTVAANRGDTYNSISLNGDLDGYTFVHPDATVLQMNHETLVKNEAGIYKVVKVEINNLVSTSGINISGKPSLIQPGDSFKLNATVCPENASFKDVTWTTGDSSILSVSDDGTVTALKPGKALISVATLDGYRQNLELVVVDMNVDISTDIENTTIQVGDEFDMTISTSGNTYGQEVMVVGTSSGLKPGDFKVMYYEQQTGEWVELTGDIFGPSEGFPFSNASSYFKVTALKSGKYDVTIKIVDANDKSTVYASDTISFTVENKPVTSVAPTTQNRVETSVSTWDNGGPFTTDSCGSVYDRWGNLIWQGTCPVNGQSTGFQLVNTADR